MTRRRLQPSGAVAAAVLATLGCTACRAPTLVRSGSDEDGGSDGEAARHDAPIDGRDAGRDSSGRPADATCGAANCFANLGLPEPADKAYTDNGPAKSDAGFRALVSLPPRDLGALEAQIAAMYTPGSATFRHYLTPADWASTYAPSAATVGTVTSFLESNGLTIVRRSTNGLLIEFSGTVGAFDKAFQTTLHDFTRANPEMGGAPIATYGVTGPAVAPGEFVNAISAIVTCDLPAAASSLKPQTGSPNPTPPPAFDEGFTPSEIAGIYGVTDLAKQGFEGAGVTLGIVSGGAFGSVDVQSFWQAFGITRADPTAVVTMETPVARLAESTIDVEWSAAMAPKANVLVYEGPDARDTSLLYTFHEAIGRGDVSIVTDSFSSREDSEAVAVRQAYDVGAIEAAALGITVLASSGDGGKTDIPSASPYVTAVGGTALSFDDGGTGFTEEAWSTSGSGTTTFDLPAWQAGVVTSGTHRVTADFSVNAGPAYSWFFIGQWSQAYGTSFSSPISAGILADVQSARAGKPALGYLNPILYGVPAVQAAFRDITTGSATSGPATIGWDPPTGWGAIDAPALAAALP